MENVRRLLFAIGFQFAFGDISGIKPLVAFLKINDGIQTVNTLLLCIAHENCNLASQAL